MKPAIREALKDYCAEMIDLDDPTLIHFISKEEAQATLLSAITRYVELLEAEVGIRFADYERAHEEARRERDEEFA